MAKVYKDFILLSIRFYMVYVLIAVLFPILGVDLSTELPTSMQFHPLTFLEQILPYSILLAMVSGFATRVSSMAVIGAILAGLYSNKFGLNITDLEQPFVWFLLLGTLMVDGAGRLSLDSKFSTTFKGK